MENDHLEDAKLWVMGALENLLTGCPIDPEDLRRAIQEIQAAQVKEKMGANK